FEHDIVKTFRVHLRQRRHLHASIDFIYSDLLRLPHAPLFPYTTLFRSPEVRDGFLAILHDDARVPRGVAQQPGTQPVGPRRTRADRKSTRLNSSHDQISYAVFCLKKKKKLIDVTNNETTNLRSIQPIQA